MQTVQQAGTVIQERYRILSVLGQGGSGITYAAADSYTGLRIALKELSLESLSDWKKLELFEREAQILQQLEHPAIPDYRDYFQVDTPNNRFFYIVQELAEGKSLADLVATGERFPETEVRRIALEVLQILQYLHELNPPVIHRDIKPQNIIRRGDGQVFLVDFGAVQTVYRETAAFGSTVVGTYGYMAPEQFRGQACPATDLYGLGATLLNLLTHRNPAEFPQHRLKYDFRSYINVSEQFAQWLDGLLEPLVEDRFSSVKEALNALISSPSERTQKVKSGAPLPLFQYRKPENLARDQCNKPAGSAVKLTRGQQHLSIKIPVSIAETDFIRILRLVVFVAGNLILCLFAFVMAVNLGSTGFVISMFILLPSICTTLTIFSKSGSKRRVLMASFEIYKNCFILAQKRRWAKAVRGSIEDISRVEISSPDSNKSSETIIIQEKRLVHQFGSHLTIAEKEWIVSEIRRYLQEHK